MLVKCEYCVFFERLSGNSGECHRHPPAVIIFDHDTHSVLPEVDADDGFCGDGNEYQNRDPEGEPK